MNFKKYLIVWVCIFGAVTCFSSAANAQNKKLIDSILTSKTPDSTKVSLLIDEAYNSALKADSAALFYAKAAQNKIGNRKEAVYLKLLSQVNNVVGIYHMFTGNFKKAEVNYAKNLAIGKQLKNDFIIAKVYGNLGGLANNQSDYKKALTYLFKALKYSENCPDPAYRPGVQGDIGNTYTRLKQYQKAVNILNEALATLVKVKDVRTEANVCNSLATAYDYMDLTSLALKAQKRSYNIYKKQDNSKGIATSALNLGNIYTETKAYVLAEKYIKESIANALSVNDVENLASGYQMLADNEQRQGRASSGLRYVDSAIHYAHIAQDRHITADLYLLKATIASKLGNHKLGYNFMNKHRMLIDSILNTDINEKVAEMETKYETEKKQRENQQLVYDNKIKTLAKNKAERDKTTVVYAAVIGLALLTIIFVSLYRNKHIRDRYKQEQIANKSLFEGEQKERIRIARDLHDSIGQLLSVIKMNLSNLGVGYKHDTNFNNTLSLVDKTITEVRHISHNLIPEELNFGLFAALEDMAEKINQAGGTQVTLNIPDEAKQHQFERSNELSIYRIVQEALSNIVKHAQASNIDLTVTAQPGGMTIAIQDDGKGFDTDTIKNSAGIGWKNIAARVNLLDGNLQVRSEKLRGTQIEITIPG